MLDMLNMIFRAKTCNYFNKLREYIVMQLFVFIVL